MKVQFWAMLCLRPPSSGHRSYGPCLASTFHSFSSFATLCKLCAAADTVGAKHGAAF